MHRHVDIYCRMCTTYSCDRPSCPGETHQQQQIPPTRLVLTSRRSLVRLQIRHVTFGNKKLEQSTKIIASTSIHTMQQKESCPTVLPSVHPPLQRDAAPLPPRKFQYILLCMLTRDRTRKNYYPTGQKPQWASHTDNIYNTNKHRLPALPI